MDENKRQKMIRQKKVMLRNVKNKMSVTFFLIVGVLLILVAEIFRINYAKGDNYSKIVLDHQSYTSVAIPYKRGMIQDRNGTVFAYSEKVYNLILDPKMILSDSQYKEPVISALNKYFGIERQTIESILVNKPSSQYEKLLKELSAEQIEEFQTFINDTQNNSYVKGVWFEESYVRKYPFSTMACDAIGFASQANGGETGLENYYDDELSGIDGISYSYVGENLEVQTEEKEAVDGYNIITTIDYTIQKIVEEKIMKMNSERPSKDTAILVMNPNNGEILAMASYPFFDLNNPRDLSGIYSEEELKNMTDEQMTTAMYALWKNYCVSTIFEPGSTFKTYTVAQALEEGIAHDETETYSCPGYIMVNGIRIRCHTDALGGHGTVDLKHGFMGSCNPTMVELSFKLSGQKMNKFYELLGFGSKTGVDLPGEESGLLIGENMSEVDAATNSFGQNLNVNMVQMASAFCSIVNGGNYYKPHIVKRIESSTGEIIQNNDKVLVRQTITKTTSDLMNKFLEAVVYNDGNSGITYLEGYKIGGKTGTAEKLPRTDLKWVSSVISVAPTDNPQVVVYTVVDEPYETEGTNGDSHDAQQMTRWILEDILPYLNVPKNGKTEDAEQSSDDSSASQVTPGQTQSGQVQPSETQSSETKPSETVSSGATSSETTPSESATQETTAENASSEASSTEKTTTETAS